MNFKQKAVVGVLASGRGSNFASLLKKKQDGFFTNLDFACLISNKKDAPALQIASENAIPAHHFSLKSFQDKDEFEAAVVQRLLDYGVNLLVLAGYMRIIGPNILNAFPNSIVNIHPSLLPSFPGLHAQDQAFHYGVKIAGCTVHFVDDGLDSGPIIGQRAVPVLETDSVEGLSARILEQEHELFAESLKRITENKWSIQDRRVVFFDK